jgi:hypothetical protein
MATLKSAFDALAFDPPERQSYVGHAGAATPVNSKARNRDIAPSCCSELYVAQQTPFFFLILFYISIVPFYLLL